LQLIAKRVTRESDGGARGSEFERSAAFPQMLRVTVETAGA
jgi:hypothetical protein